MALALIQTAAQMRLWAAKAQPGASCLYHAGSLALDREDCPAIESLADLVLALSEAHLVLTAQDRARTVDASLYVATRLSGRGDHVLVTGDLSPVHWRALRALRDREERMSASRCVARALTMPEKRAKVLVAELADAGMIEPEPSSRGQAHMALTAKGRRAAG